MLADSGKTNLKFAWKFLQHFVNGENQILALESAFETEKVIFFAIQKIMANFDEFSDSVVIESARIPEDLKNSLLRLIVQHGIG